MQEFFDKVEEIANLPNVAATVLSSNEGMRRVRCIISDQPWIATPYPGIVQWLFGWSKKILSSRNCKEFIKLVNTDVTVQEKGLKKN